MRVAFDVTTCAKPRRGGIATYGWELIGACARVAPRNDYRLVLRPNRWMARRHLKPLGARLAAAAAAAAAPDAAAAAREELDPPLLLLDAFADLCLGSVDVLHSIGVRLPGRGRFAKVVTLHDLNVFEFPELSSPEWRDKRQARIRQTLARADRVIVYSRAGAAALQRLLGFPAERVRVVPIGVDPAHFHPLTPEQRRPALQALGLAEGPYVLHVGAFSERKNQRGALAAFARAGLPDEWTLVLVGPSGDDAAALAARARELGLDERRLRLPGWVGGAEYRALLCGATISLCASLHEGFGIPVIEAQACGTPVLCSDRGALPETLGECGVLVDVTDEAAFAAALARLAGDERLRARLASEGPARVAREFSWETVARKTLAVYQDAGG
jgi:glycosyltransferase involved in cell wall biosynthesis